MKTAIIGAGAMGCLYACMLSEKHAVTLFDISREVVGAINTHGILCHEADGSERVFRVHARCDSDDTERFDLVILFVKDTVSESALAGNRGLIGKHTILLSLQNGMGNEEIMEKFVPRDGILLGTTKHNCVCTAPGEIYHSGAGVTHIGSPAHNRAMAEGVAEAFAACGVESEVCDNVRRLLWEKLFVNMTINPLTALLGTTIGALAENPFLREVAHDLLVEATAVAAADGEAFDAEELYVNLIRTAEVLSTGKASMYQDILNKRRTEVDFINGAVVRLGKKYGVPTPLHEQIVRLIHAKERL